MSETTLSPAERYTKLRDTLRSRQTTTDDEFSAVDPAALAGTQPIWLAVRVVSRVVGPVHDSSSISVDRDCCVDANAHDGGPGTV